MSTVLLISNKVMHYRVSVYNYFYEEFKKNGFDFVVASTELQEQNPHSVQFRLEILGNRFCSYANLVKRIKPSAVIVFLHLKDVFFWPLIHWLKIKKIPAIFWTKGVNLDALESSLSRTLFKYIHGIFDGLLLYSPNETMFIPEKHRQRISIANNALNHYAFPSDENRLDLMQSKLGISFHRIALFAGRMGVGGGRKKVAHAVEVFNRIKENGWGLVIVGSGMPEAVREQMNPKNTCYLGEVYDEGELFISALHRMAHIALLPGHVGLGLNHAFYWGLPVVTEKGNQPPEIRYLQDGVNGYMVPENDIDMLQEKVELLFSNDSLRERMSASAKERIMEVGSIERMFDGFLSAVTRLST
jgi:glycosyltransferase involved in cell wall biosynthesis